MNPGSRSGKGQKLWKIWESSLRDSGMTFDSVVTQGPGDAFRICMASHDIDVLVAVGGDGTISEVLDGIIQSGNPQLRLGVLYSGTSPDFCRFHGIPVDPQKAVATLISGRTRNVDVVRIKHSVANGAGRISHFGCSCNIGLGASVARFSNQVRWVLGDGLGTSMAVIRALMLSTPIDLDLEIDGEKQSLARVNNISILKNPYIASGLKLNLNIMPDDGTLQLVGIQARSRMGLCALLPGFYSGKAASSRCVFIRKCTRIRVHSRQPQEVEYDGDPRGYLPVEIQVLPRALKLIGGSYE